MIFADKSFWLKAILAILAVGLVLLLVLSQSAPAQDFRINEISFANNSGHDWVEIYNPSMNTRSLKGFYLTDSREAVTKYQLQSDIFLPPGGFTVIYGKDYDALDKKYVNKANFNIKNGETLYLINANQEVVDSLTTVLAEGNATGTTVGRFPDGGDDLFVFSRSTPGARNQKDMPFEPNLPLK